VVPFDDSIPIQVGGAKCKIQLVTACALRVNLKG
jgi:hypothetical protein